MAAVSDEEGGIARSDTRGCPPLVPHLPRPHPHPLIPAACGHVPRRPQHPQVRAWPAARSEPTGTHYTRGICRHPSRAGTVESRQGLALAASRHGPRISPGPPLGQKRARASARARPRAAPRAARTSKPPGALCLDSHGTRRACRAGLGAFTRSAPSAGCGGRARCSVACIWRLLEAPQPSPTGRNRCSRQRPAEPPPALPQTQWASRCAGRVGPRLLASSEPALRWRADALRGPPPRAPVC
jgi:hypothetical protein